MAAPLPFDPQHHGPPDPPDQGHDTDADRDGMAPELLAALAAHPQEIGHLVRVLNGRVTDELSLLALMRQVAVEAARLLPRARWAGVTAEFDGAPFTIAHTDRRVLVVDELQYDRGDGPCLQAMHTGVPVQMSTAEIAERWPALGEAAQAAGVRSVHAEPIFADGIATAALNLYSDQDDGPVGDDQEILRVFTEYLDRGMRDYVRAVPTGTAGIRLQQAVHLRAQVAEAQGIVMERHHLDAVDALALLHHQADRWGTTPLRWSEALRGAPPES